MAVCPSCKAEMIDPRAPCRRCGKGRSDANAVPDLDLGGAGGAAARHDAIGLEGDGPSLDLAPARAAPGATQAASRGAPSQGSGGGALFDEDDDLLDGPGLALELDVRPTHG